MPPPRQKNNFVGEAVGYLACGVFGGVLVVLAKRRTWGYCVFLASKKEAVDDEFAALHAEAAEGDHGGRGGSVGPLCGNLISEGPPGVDWGRRLFETMSKMPALKRSL